MNKAELVSSVAAHAKVTKVDAERAIEATFQSITDSLRKGDEVRLIGFGIFSVRHRPETEGRNPRTGTPITIPAKRVAKFQPSKALKESLEKK